MARNFNGTSDYVSVADHAALATLSYSAFSFWIRCDTMADLDRHNIMNWGVFGANPNIYCAIYGDNHANAGGIRFYYKSSLGVAAAIDFNDKITDSNWHHVAVSYVSSITTSGWLDGVLQTDPGASLHLRNMDVSGSWYFGSGSGDNKFFAGDIAEFAKFDAALSTEQIAALAAGVRPTEIGTRPSWYWPGLLGLDEEIAGLTMTNSGTTAAEHPPKIIMQSKQIIF